MVEDEEEMVSLVCTVVDGRTVDGLIGQSEAGQVISFEQHL